MEKIKTKNESAKVTMSHTANEAMQKMFNMVNKDFKGGKITKHQLLSWIVIEFETTSFQKCIRKIQTDHFDKMAYLEITLREAKRAKNNGSDLFEVNKILNQIITLRIAPKEKADCRYDVKTGGSDEEKVLEL